jgi:Leucine-rich repeat (LRR) protein
MNNTVNQLKQTLNGQGGRFGCFSENFYTFITEKIGITHIQKLDSSKPGPSFADRMAKVEKMIERAEFEDDKLSPSEQAIAKYSDEALDLSCVVKKIGLQKDICNKEYLTRFFKTFYMQRSGIERLDAGLLDFTNLQVLDLSHNKI